jgi:hypothetical protein
MYVCVCVCVCTGVLVIITEPLSSFVRMERETLAGIGPIGRVVVTVLVAFDFFLTSETVSKHRK